ncbi:MAG: hypothetical protein H6732_04610 [Alphaproteobacteria bacterium]|nr:hypothetical protein [Alphaproteobacteria bacterium]
MSVGAGGVGRAMGVVGVSLLVGGCAPLGDDLYPKPDDLSPEWQLDRVRVLAIRAEPPEIDLGQSSVLEGLVVDPYGDVALKVWNACPPDEDGGGDFGCIADLPTDGLSPDSLDLDALRDAGILAIEPIPGFSSPTYTPTCSDIRWPDRCTDNPTGCSDPSLDLAACCDQIGLAACPQLEKLYSLIQVAAIPGDALAPREPADPDAPPQETFDFNDVEVAFKRLVVSASPTPNTNPALARFHVDGLVVHDEDTVVEVDAGQTYTILAVLADDAAQDYTYVPSSCREPGDPPVPDACADPALQDPSDECAPQCRAEEPYVKWYATGGVVREPTTLFGFLDTTWTAPSTDDPVLVTEGDVWAVSRDRRGGIAWRRLRWRLRALADAP